MKPLELWDWQKVDQEFLARHNWTALAAVEMGGAKGHPLDEPVLTPGGWVPVGELEVGDEVVGSDGLPTKITGVFDRGILPVYRVSFRDGSSVRVDGEHLWRVRHSTNVGRVTWSTKATEDIARLKRLDIYEIPTTEVEHAEADLPIDPYALGALIADGYLTGTGVQWTKNDLGVAQEMREALSRTGFTLTDRAYVGVRRYGVLGVTPVLKELGLRVSSGGKFIPRMYFISSVAQRTALVNGLFDGDGSVRRERGSASYATTSVRLAEDVRELLWSLGVGATLHFKKSPRGGYWEVHVHGGYNPFLRHPDKHLVTGTARRLRRAFASIELVEETEVRCISVAASDHLYVTKDYIVTHNTMLAVEAIRNSGAERVLIVAPKQAHHTAWIPTVERQLGLTARVIGNGRKADREALADFEWGSPGIYLVTPQFLTRADVSRWEGDMLAVDEALALDTPVPTPTGWTTVGEVEVGDYVVSPTGWPTKVTGLTPVRVGDTFRLTTDRGEEIVTDAGHLWVAAPRTHGGTNYLKYREVTTQEMFDRNTVWRIERPEPIVLPEAELPIDPYILGQWLGNGSRSQQHVAVRREHVVDFIAEVRRRGYEAREIRGKSGVSRVTLGREFFCRLRETGLLGNKHIPGVYLRASLTQRLDLLRGLMDSDGYLNARGTGATFVNTNESLYRGVAELARTMGYLVTPPAEMQDNEWTDNPCYRVYFTGFEDIDPFLIRNSGRARGPSRRVQEIRVVKIERTTPVPVRCIRVDSPDHMFLAGEHMIPTHNCHELSKAGGKGQRKLSGYSAKDGEPLAQRFVHRLALSGTPARNNFERLWATMRLLWPELGDPGQVANMSHWGWLKERMGSAQVFVGNDMWGAPKYATKWIGERSPGRLFNEAPAVIQHFRRHRCCEFHPEGFLTNEEPMVAVREVELTARQKKAIREMEDHYMTWLGDNPLVADLTITQKQRIRQMCLGVPTVSEEGEVTFEPDCASPFYDELVNILESLDEGEPVVVFVESQKFARVVSDRLNGDGYSAFEYSGKTTRTRNEDLSRFGKDFQVAVVVISAGGTGLDGLQQVANTEVWLERSVDGTLVVQAEARLDRLGATKGVQRFVILDDLGYAEGRMNRQIEKMIRLRESTRKRV